MLSPRFASRANSKGGFGENGEAQWRTVCDAARGVEGVCDLLGHGRDRGGCDVRNGRGRGPSGGGGGPCLGGRVHVGARMHTDHTHTRALSQIRVLALGDSITTGGGYPVFVVSEATRREEGRALTRALADGDGQVSRRTRSSCLAPLPTLPTRFPGPSLSPRPPLPTCHPSLQGNTVAHTYTHTQERERASERESECARERE